MHECNAMQILETKKEKTQKPENNDHEGKAMKHKDHDNKTVQGHRITLIT